jgi:hypothetical protein
MAVRRPAIGNRYGSAYGTVNRATTCAARYRPKKKPAYPSEAVEMTDWRAM